MQKICIFGAGAVGGNMAAHMARSGLQVSVVARGAHLAAIRERGLRLITTTEDFTVQVRASDKPADLGEQDLVISTVKAHALCQAASSFEPLLNDETPIIFAVNGIPWWYFQGMVQNAMQGLPRLDPQGVLRSHIGTQRVLGCVIRSPNDVVAPGVIRSSSSVNRYTIGEPDGSNSARLQKVVAALHACLPGASATTNIRREIWMKLALNVPSSIMAVLTMSTGPEILGNPQTRDLYRKLGDETNAVAEAYGEQAGFDLEAQIASAGNNRHPPSMLQDLIAGRPMEIDAQLCVLQDLARQAKLATPLLDITLALLMQRANSDFAAGLLAGSACMPHCEHNAT